MLGKIRDWFRKELLDETPKVEESSKNEEASKQVEETSLLDVCTDSAVNTNMPKSSTTPKIVQESIDKRKETITSDVKNISRPARKNLDLNFGEEPYDSYFYRNRHAERFSPKLEVTIIVYENIEYTSSLLHKIEGKILKCVGNKESESLKILTLNAYYGSEEKKFNFPSQLYFGKSILDVFMHLKNYLQINKLKDYITSINPAKTYSDVKCVRIIFVGNGNIALDDSSLEKCQLIMNNELKERSIITNYITLNKHEIVSPAILGFRTIECLEDTYSN